MTTNATPAAVGSNDQLGLVGRLRAPSMTDTTATHIDRMRMAADEIERLRDRLAKATEAFEREQTRADAAEVRAETAVAAERERCAKLCDDYAWLSDEGSLQRQNFKNCAAGIRKPANAGIQARP